MQLRKSFGITILALATAAGAQAPEYTEYLGEINVGVAALPLAADSGGNIYFGTFAAGISSVYAMPDPESQINQPEATKYLLQSFPDFPAQRGLQSLQVTSQDHLIVAGDSGNVTEGNIWKLNRTGTGPTDYSLDPTFTTNADLAPSRRHAVSIMSDDGLGNGVIIANGLNNIDFFDFNGNHISGPFAIAPNYMREGVYNSQDNVFYAIRNGDGSQVLLKEYLTDVNIATGGTIVNDVLIPDGASNGQFGSARQNAYYYADHHQLITMDGDVLDGDATLPPNVRVWNIDDNGTALNLAYTLTGLDSETPFPSLGDAVVVNNKLYVSASGQGKIFVFGPAEASVGDWESYSSTSLPTAMTLE